MRGGVVSIVLVVELGLLFATVLGLRERRRETVVMSLFVL